MRIAEAGQREFRVRRVLGTPIELLSRDFLRFYAAAAIPVAAAAGLQLRLFLSLAPRQRRRVRVRTVWGFGRTRARLLWRAHGAGDHRRGGHPLRRDRGPARPEARRRRHGGRGPARIFPILGLILLIGATLIGVGAVVLIAVSFGLRSLLGLVLAVPLVAVIVLAILTRWFVALPACVIERLGPLRSIGRSSYLTRGYRWRVFGIYLLILVVGTLLQPVLN